jgi:hypothetical protein
MRTLTRTLFIVFLIPTLLLADDFEDFEMAMTSFHTSPSQQGFEELQSNAEIFEKELCGEDNGAGLLVAVMVARISEKHDWPISGKGKIATLAKEVREGTSDYAKYILDDEQVDPGKLDIWWCSYFATGDTKYLDLILTYAGEELPKEDINMMLTIGAATWSFKSNCKQHESIKRYALERVPDKQYAHKKAYLQECAGVPVDRGFSWRDEDGKAVPNTDNKKTINGFGAQLLITDNLDFYDDWEEPETPHISIAKTVTIGETVIPLVIFVNPHKDDDNCINVTCDVTITQPDGTIAQELPNIPCGSGVFEAPQYNLQLSQSELRWSAENNDPPGEWNFTAIVKDHNRGIEIPLSTTIEIIEPEITPKE